MKTPATSPSPLLSANPKAGYLAHKREIDEAVARSLESGHYILGREVAAFEEEFARFAGAGFATGVGNGTDALELALRACGVGPGDFVVTVSHTAVATVTAIDLVGAVAVLVDIDPVSFTMDPGRLEAAFKLHGDKVKAVIPVHLYGQPADMRSILALARGRGIRVIEDCAQAHGALYDGTPVGSIGDIGAFSFYPTKNLGALGDGGAIATRNAALADKARMIRQYGWRERYLSDIAGMNTRLDEVQAAILRVKLRHLDSGNARRREIAAAYNRGLADTPLTLPAERASSRHVYHQYVVRSAARDGLQEFLSKKSIGTAVHYPVPVHLQPGYAARALAGPGGLAATERACGQILSLPMYPELSDEQVGSVIAAIRAWGPAT